MAGLFPFAGIRVAACCRSFFPPFEVLSEAVDEPSCAVRVFDSFRMPDPLPPFLLLALPCFDFISNFPPFSQFATFHALFSLSLIYVSLLFPFFPYYVVLL